MSLDDWAEIIVFFGWFASVMSIPCLVIAIMGRKMLFQLGQFPSQKAPILMKFTIKLFFLEVVSFAALFWFYFYYQTLITTVPE